MQPFGQPDHSLSNIFGTGLPARLRVHEFRALGEAGLPVEWQGTGLSPVGRGRIIHAVPETSDRGPHAASARGK